VTSVLDSSGQFGERAREQMFQFWVDPELDRRRREGQLKEDCRLIKANDVLGVLSLELTQDDPDAGHMTAAFLMAEMPDEQVIDSKKHTFFASRLNLRARHGGPRQPYARLLNDLGEMRPRTRYLSRKLDLTVEEAREKLGVAKEMHDRLVEESPPERKPLPEL
jgi:hypothetical protein